MYAAAHICQTQETEGNHLAFCHTPFKASRQFSNFGPWHQCVIALGRHAGSNCLCLVTLSFSNFDMDGPWYRCAIALGRPLAGLGANTLLLVTCHLVTSPEIIAR